MVDLLTSLPPVTTSEAPRSALSPGQIASPYQQLGAAFGKVAEGLNEVAVPLAEQAGARAVTTDADGNPQIQKSLFIGKAADAYERAANFKYLATVEPQIHDKMAEFRVQYHDDAAKFKTAADSFTTGLIKDIPNPALANAVQKVAADAGSSNYRTLLLTNDQLNVENTATALKSTLADKRNKMDSLAFNGMTDSKEYQSLQGDVGAIYAQLRDDPRMHYPQERIDLELADMASKNKLQMIAGQAVRLTDSGSATAKADAKKWLVDRAYDPELNLSMVERHQFVSSTLSLLDARTGDAKALIEDKELTGKLLGNLSTASPYDPVAVNDQIERSRQLGDVGSYYKLLYAKTFHDWDATARSLPLPQKLAALGSLTSAPASASLEDRIVMAESGGQPFARSATSRAAGAGMFIPDTWLATIKQSRPDLAAGKSDQQLLDMRTDLGLSREMVKAYAEQNRKALTAAGVRSDDGALYLAHFLGPSDAIKVLGADPNAPVTGLVNPQSVNANERVFANNATAGQLTNWAAGKVGPASQSASGLFFEEQRQAELARFREHLKQESENLVGSAETALGRGVVPPELQTVANVVHEVGADATLGRRLTVAAEAYDKAAGLEGQPNSVRQMLAGQMQLAAAQGGTAIERDVADRAAKNIFENLQAMQEKPYTTAALRRMTGQPTPFDFTNPDQVAGEAKRRVEAQATISHVDGTKPISIFEGAEATAFQTTLAQGDPAKAGAILSSLATTLPPDIFSATMEAGPAKAGLMTMANSNDPARLNVGMSTLDRFWRTDPSEFKAKFDDGALTRLQAWQALRGAFTPQEVAERLSSANDPQIAEARKSLAETAKEELKSTSPRDISNLFGSWADRHLPFVNQAEPGDFVQGQAPVLSDGVQARAIKNEFGNVYTALRSYGVDPTQAKDLTVKRLQSEWSVSQVAGGALMRYAPESSKLYAPIDGSRDWMRSDLDNYLTASLGPQFEGEPGAMAATPHARWSMQGLISNPQTEADISAGRPPSYKVAVRNEAGVIDILPNRIAWDRAPHVAKAEADFGAWDATLKERRALQADYPPAFGMVQP